MQLETIILSLSVKDVMIKLQNIFLKHFKHHVIDLLAKKASHERNMDGLKVVVS